MLSERMARFVETALHRSTPTRALTLAVLAALPVYATTASAATVGASVAKGTAAAKTAAVVGVLGAIIGPIVGVIGGWSGVKMSLANATSAKERQLIIRFTRVVVVLAALVVAANIALVFLGERLFKTHPILLGSSIIGFWLLFGTGLLTLILRFNKLQRRIRQEVVAKETPDQAVIRQVYVPFEYRSRWTFLGLPVIHVRLGRGPDEPLRPALGWIAIGDYSIGVLFSFGGIALGGISIGGVSVGIASFGGIAGGVLAGGGLAIGLWAVGGAALGYLASGGVAMAWHAAQGGLAIAHDFAQGGVAHAAHANDAFARAFFESHSFFQYAGDAMRGGSWVALLCWLPMILILWHTVRIRRAQRQK
jgi:hypothetical protein